MPYFSTNQSGDNEHYKASQSKATSVTKKEYPEFITVKSYIQEKTEDSKVVLRCEEPKKSTQSSWSILQTAFTMYLMFLVAVHFTSPNVPTILSDIFLGAYDRVTPKIIEAYAGSGEETQDESNETELGNDEEIVNDTAVAEKSSIPEDSEPHFKSVALGENTESANTPIAVSLDISERKATSEKAIVGRNLSVGQDRIYSTDETGLSHDVNSMAVSAYPIERIYADEALPRVLIVHTHGTECYSDSASGGVRSTDRNENVTRVGRELSDVLNYYGIETLHSDTMHDEASYLTAYSSSKREVQRLLELHPTIRYVIDLHRDAIPDDGGLRVKPITSIAGEDTAQIMFVVGTNAGGGTHPNYKENLTVASHLQKSLNERYPTLARPINIRSAVFNQSLGAGCILLEVGSDANTLEEALRAVRLFGTAFAATVLGVDSQ